MAVIATEASGASRVFLLFLLLGKFCHGPTRAFNRAGRFV
jgi:hypothetical protein